MSMRDVMIRIFAVVLALASGAGASGATDAPRLGMPISAADLAAWDISVMPNGTGLPPGAGRPEQGEKIYVARCMVCHGEQGAGAHLGPALSSIGKSKQFRLIGNFWPYATTIFDYTRRAMPWASPKRLSDDQVYALTAYILASNKIIGESEEMNAETLPKVRMPNQDRFNSPYTEKH